MFHVKQMTRRTRARAGPAAAELFGEHLDAGRAFTTALARHGEELA